MAGLVAATKDDASSVREAERQELMRQGLTRPQAEWVLEDYLRWIMNDIHATPVDPAKLNKLPSP